MLKGWWTYAVVLIAMLGALSACNSGDGDDDVVEDVPFFYPIVGVIRHNLLKNLCHEVISRYGIN